MSYPNISPCPMAPILHPASRRKAQLARSTTDLQDCSHTGETFELGVPFSRSRSTKNMLELQPVNGTDSEAKTHSDTSSSMESYIHLNQQICSGVRNYEHLVQSSHPPANTDDCILLDHNGNNENWHYVNAANLHSTKSLDEDYTCSSCSHQRQMSHLCMSTSLPRNVATRNDPGYRIPAIFSRNDSGLGEMAEADQDITVFSQHRNLHEDEVFERSCSFGQELCIPEHSISMLHDEYKCCGDKKQAGVQEATDTNYSNTEKISSTAARSAKMMLQKLDNADTQPLSQTSSGLVEIGRCSIYFDPQTGKYHSTVFGSFPRDRHSVLNPVNDRASRRDRATLGANEYPSSPRTECAESSSLPNMPWSHLLHHKNITAEPNSFRCIVLKDSGDGGSTDDSRCESNEDFNVYGSDQMTVLSCQLATSGRWSQSKGTEPMASSSGHLSVSDHHLGKCDDHITPSNGQLTTQSQGKDLDQLVHTYPGPVAYKHEATFISHAQGTSCDCRHTRKQSLNTDCTDKCDAVVQRGQAGVQSHFKCDDDAVTIQANNSLKHFPCTASLTEIYDQSEMGKNQCLHESRLSHSTELPSQPRDRQGQNLSKLSTKQNNTSFSLSSLFGNIFSRKERDKSQANEDACGRKQQDLRYASKCQNQPRLPVTSHNERLFSASDLTDQAATTYHGQYSPHERCKDVYQEGNSSPGINEQTHKSALENSEDSDVNDENSEERKKHALLREMSRNYVAYLCCPPDALTTFGLPFHRLLESWGLPIFIPERNLPLCGPKYKTMAECVEENCNGKVIVVLSNTYATSEECLFLTYFAKTLDPDSRLRNIIPVLIDSDVEIPSVLRGLSLIKYNHLVRSGWLKEKLVNAIAA